MFGFRRFLFERREGGNFVELAASAINVFVSRRACAVFCSVGFRGFLGLWQFFVGAVVAGNYFVELARLIFVSRWACAIAVSELRDRSARGVSC